jgi:hypothetical protein
MRRTMRAVFVFGLLGAAVFSGSAQSQEGTPRFEAGPVFSFLRIPYSPPINEQNQAEFGGRFTWNLKPFFAIEFEAAASPFQTPNLTTAYQGGNIFQVFAGAKAGKRWNKFGVFAKFRPGLNSYSQVIRGHSQGMSLPSGRRIDPCFDVGGVLEFYVSRRLLIRYDAGDTIIDYRSSSLSNPTTTLPVPGATKNNFQISTAVLFRF